MQFEEHTSSGSWVIHSYQTGKLEINGNTHTQAICLLDHECLPCPETTAQSLTADSFLPLLATHTAPEVILVGTGEKQYFLHPKIAATLAAQGIGLESMNTASACRTLMILQSEGRRVWVWLFP